MNKQESINYRTEQLRHAEAAKQYAQAQLGKLTVDEMLMPNEPISNENWPGATDMGEYLDRTVPSLDGRDI